MNNIDHGPELRTSRSEYRKTVLLVDDDANLLRSLTRCLKADGYEILTAISAAEANVQLNRNQVDLIVSDNFMPGIFGTEFLADVHQQYPKIKLFILSGYIPERVAHRAMEDSGVLCVFNKPCPSNDVAAAIRDALTDASIHHSP
ncbi:MAG: response regulator [Fuerstiella sp.]